MASDGRGSEPLMSDPYHTFAEYARRGLERGGRNLRCFRPELGMEIRADGRQWRGLFRVWGWTSAWVHGASGTGAQDQSLVR